LYSHFRVTTLGKDLLLDVRKTLLFYGAQRLIITLLDRVIISLAPLNIR